MTKKIHHAFTITELIVVIAIIALLLGLLLPAIQNVREAASRAKCINNIKQIVLACHSYHDTQSAFPPGMSGPQTKTPYMSWLTHILPFIEQQALWDSTTIAYSQIPDFTVNPPHIGNSTVISLYQCPDLLIHTSIVPLPSLTVTFTTYLGVAGGQATVPDGIFFQNSIVKLTDITDGSSNTICLGERHTSPDSSGYYYFGWWYAGTGQSLDGSGDYLLWSLETNRSPRLFACPLNGYQYRPGQSSNPCDLLHFWSPHPGGANFGFADGSVKLFPYSASNVLPAISTRAGGEIVDLSDY
jgi:prepilin-type processing-associated H-X9-DG protein/prepilin-type N-terminal cleavage/methylation domain-containing protein